MFKCIKCGSEQFEWMAFTHDQIKAYGSIDDDGNIDVEDYGKDICGNTEIDRDNPIICQECGASYNWNECFPEPPSAREPFIWLQEQETMGRADCGCRLHIINDSPAFFMCQKHQQAVVLLQEMHEAYGNLRDKVCDVIESNELSINAKILLQDGCEPNGLTDAIDEKVTEWKS